MLAIRRVPQKGMTLIELMISIAVLAVLVTLALPGIQTWMLNSRIRTGTEDMLAGLQTARGEAVRRNANVQFVLGTGAGWTVQLPVGDPNCATTPMPPCTIQTRSASDGTVGVTVTPTPGAATMVTFNGLGRPTGAGNLTQVDIDLSSTILPAATTRELRITIGVSGQIRMCDPNATNITDSRHC